MKSFLLRPLPTLGVPPVVSLPYLSSVPYSSGSPSVAPFEQLSGSGRLNHVHCFPSSLLRRRTRSSELFKWCAVAPHHRVSPSCLTLSPLFSSATLPNSVSYLLPPQKQPYRYAPGNSSSRQWEILYCSNSRSSRSSTSCVGSSPAADEWHASFKAAEFLLHNRRSSTPACKSSSNRPLSVSGSNPLPSLLRLAPPLSNNSSRWNCTHRCAYYASVGSGPLLEQQLIPTFYGSACPTLCLTHPAATTPASLYKLSGDVFPLSSRLSRRSTSSSSPSCPQFHVRLSTHVSSLTQLSEARGYPFSPVSLNVSLSADGTPPAFIHQKRARAVWRSPSCSVSSEFCIRPFQRSITAWSCRRGAIPSVSTPVVPFSLSGRTQPQQSVCLSRHVCAPQPSRVLLSAAVATERKGEEPRSCSGAYGRHLNPHHAAVHASFQSIDTNNDGYISKKEFFAWACCHLLPLLPQQLIESEASPFHRQYTPRCMPPGAITTPVPSHPERLQQQQELHHMLPPHRRLLLQQKQQHLQQQQRHPDEPRQQRLHLKQQQYVQPQEKQSQLPDGGAEGGEIFSVERGETVAQCLIKAGAFARSWRRKKEKTVDASTALLVATWASIPYVGFGFMDNCLMLLCGEMIDTHIGAALGVSTLAAAGLGNLLSCASGVVTGGCVERLAAKITLLPRVQLSSAQSNAKVISRARTAGALVGICCGCILGLFPLLFFGIKRKASPAPQGSCEGEDVPEQ